MPKAHILILSLLLSTLTLISCVGSGHTHSKVTSPDSSNKNVPINKKVNFILKNNGSKIRHSEINLLQHDSLFFGTPFKLVDTLSIDLPGNEGFVILSDKSQTPIWVTAGDTIFFTASDIEGSVGIRSSNKEKNDFIGFMQEVTRKYGAIFPFVFDFPPQQRKVDSPSTLKVVETEINKLKQDRIKFLQDYNEKLTMSDLALKESNDFINLAAMNDSILLYQNNRKILADLQLFESKLSAVTSSVKRIGFEGNFPYYFVYSNLVDLAANLPDIITNKGSFETAIGFTSKNIHHAAKDFLLSRYVYRAIRNDIIASDQYANYVQLELPYAKFLSKKISLLNYKQKVLANDSYLNSQSNKTSLLEEIIDKHKGKVILIDFWASWCQPCIAEFPNSNKLLQTFSNNEFSILYFSIDQEFDKWQQAVEKYKLNKNNSYLIGSDNKLLKELKVKSIPRYVLMDTSGNIWHANAPRPGTEEIHKKINLLLGD